MAYNGAGTFLINSAGQPVVAGTTISETVFNALTADLATGLSTAITKDGQTTPTANLPMGGFKMTGLGAGSAATDSARIDQVQGGAVALIAVTGTDTVVGTLSPTLTAYAAGQRFAFVAAGTNTTSMTLNINGLGAKAITRAGAVALISGDITIGKMVTVVYDGTQFQTSDANSFNTLEVLNSSGSGQIAYGYNGLNYLTAAGAAATLQIQATGANGQITAATNGIERIRVSASGNVGIGTTAPGYKLEVASNANTNDGIYVSNTNTGASAQAVINVAAQGWNGVQLVQNRTTGTAQVYLGDNAPLLLATNATTRMTILGDGKIGVGSTTPNSYQFPAQGGQYISNQFLTVGTSTLGPSVTGPVPTNAEFGVGIDFVSDTGKYAGAGGTTASNKVGLYVSATANTNSGNVWALNPILNLTAGSVAAGNAQIAEFDLAQSTGVDYGDTAGYAGFVQPAVLGVQITGVGSRATAALAVLGTSFWNRGIVAGALSVVQSFLEDYSSATQSYYIAGSHTYGINTNDGTFSGATIRLGTQQKVSWRNAANSADLNMLQSTSTDGLIIGTGASDVFISVNGVTNGLQVDANANIYPTKSASTTMTGGFFYIPAAPGAPTGVPSSVGGHLPMYFDATNNNFYIYNGAWKKVTLT